MVKCRLCSSEAVSVWFVAWQHEIWSCRTCRFMFARPLADAPEPRYEGDYFQSFIERDRSPETLRQYQHLLRELEELTEGRVLVDAGCGAGGFASVAKSRGWSVHGLDASVSAVRHTATTLGITAECANLNTYEFRQDSVDVIHAFHVLEHLENPRHFLLQSAAGLRPGGLLHLGLPFYTRVRIGLHQALRRLRVANFPYNFNLPDHVSYFGPRTLVSALQTCGFYVVRTWFTARVTLADLVTHLRQCGGARKMIGNTVEPLNTILAGFGVHRHINVIARRA